jgi:uncharacterized protein
MSMDEARQTGAGAPAGRQTKAPATGRRSRDMDEAETLAVVERNYWGTLSTADGDLPYAIPIIYGYDDRRFYVVMGKGRKMDAMEANPHVCLTIVEVEEMARRWRSVLASGTVDWVEGDDAVAAAIDVIRRQYPGLPVRSSAGAPALAAMGFRVARITADTMTGRAQE